MNGKNQSLHFLSLELEKIGCFCKKQTIELKDKDGNPARWNFIVGNNACGKTTLLKILSGNSTHSLREPQDIVFETKMRHFDFLNGIKNSRVKACFLSNYCFCGKNKKKYMKNKSIYMSYYGNGKHKENNCSCGEMLICHGYGVGRSFSKYYYPSLSLFDDDDCSDIDIEYLLLDIYELASRNKKHEIHKERIERMIIEILSDLKKIHYKLKYGNGMVFLEMHSGSIRIGGLNLGYLTMLALCIDFAYSMILRFPDSKNPLAEPSILLVDEIELHLHPQWQRKLISSMTKFFPNTQFIATTNSPLILLSASDANIVLLSKDGGEITIDNNPVLVRNFRIDQVYTSDLFGLDSARSQDTEFLLKKRSEILSKQKFGDDDKNRLDEINEKLGYLPFGENSDEIKADFLMKEIARKISNKEKNGK